MELEETSSKKDVHGPAGWHRLAIQHSRDRGRRILSVRTHIRQESQGKGVPCPHDTPGQTRSAGRGRSGLREQTSRPWASHPHSQLHFSQTFVFSSHTLSMDLLTPTKAVLSPVTSEHRKPTPCTVCLLLRT